MIKARVYGTHARARAAAADLRDRGVLAFPADLDEFDALPPPDPADWLDQTEPDLSRLPTDLPVPCAQCRHDLRPLISGGDCLRCPECGTHDGKRRAIARAFFGLRG